MTRSLKLVVKDGVLFLPIGGCDDQFEPSDQPTPVLYQAPSGAFESIGFPLANDGSPISSELKLAIALRNEFVCNPYLTASDVIRLPDGTVFEFGTVLAAHGLPSPTVAHEMEAGVSSGYPRLRVQLALSSQDPVHQEMCRLWAIVKSDAQLTTLDRRRLRQRILSELNLYELWQRRFASYHGQPVRWTPPQPPASSAKLPLADMYLPLPPDKRPTVHVYADSIGFTCKTHRTRIDGASAGLESSLVPQNVTPYLVDWRPEYKRLSWYDPSNDDPGTMWIALDIGGMSIARAVKRYVGDAARVIYSKPHMDPYFDYESFREIRCSSVVVLERR